MRVMVLGADGYLGWPMSMYLSNRGYDVISVDNYSRRNICMETGNNPLFPVDTLEKRSIYFNLDKSKKIKVEIGNLCDINFTERLFREHNPDAVIHFAEQPSAPYSMMGYKQAHYTLNNNINSTLNIIWAIKKHSPQCHIIKLGTMGEYGTPNIDIEEGWLEINHKGRRDKFLYPRAASSLYHTSKILDTDLLWFYVRSSNIRVTDLMQGPVYGIQTLEMNGNKDLYPFFNYDECFGTVINRFIVQAVCEIPLTVYGAGEQKRGYINIIDTMKCIELSLLNPPQLGELNIMNQYTEVFSVNELAEKVRVASSELGLKCTIKSVVNPRIEKEDHYYNPTSSNLKDLGLSPTYLTIDKLKAMINEVLSASQNINKDIILPRTLWKD